MYNTFPRTSNHRLCACVLTDDPEVAQLYKERNLFSKEADVVERREGETPRFGLILINHSRMYFNFEKKAFSLAAVRFIRFL